MALALAFSLRHLILDRAPTGCECVASSSGSKAFIETPDHGIKGYPTTLHFAHLRFSFVMDQNKKGMGGERWETETTLQIALLLINTISYELGSFSSARQEQTIISLYLTWLLCYLYASEM